MNKTLSMIAMARVFVSLGEAVAVADAVNVHREESDEFNSFAMFVFALFHICVLLIAIFAC